MAQRTTLTEQQVSVLRWIAEGCPDGVMKDSHHRISAAALRRRGLVTIRGKRHAWSASVTAAGVEYLARVDGPEPPDPRQPNVSVSEQLMNDIAAAGGVLRVPRRGWASRGGIDYEHRAQLAERHGKVPPGKWLVVEPHGGEVELRLEDMPAGVPAVSADLAPVSVPEKISRYHPVARSFRDGKSDHQVSRDALQRATRIVHAVAVEARRRGWNVASAVGGLVVEPPGISVHATLKENGVHRRGPWEEEVARYRNYRPLFMRERPVPSGAYDQDATGQLEVAIDVTPRGGFSGRQSRWADRQAWALEERLPHLFREIEIRIVLAERFAIRQQIEADRAAEERRRAQEEREQRWQQLMSDARRRLVEDQRAAMLRAQADAWLEAERLRRYCTKLDEIHGNDPGTQEFLAWARAHVAAIDPMRIAPALPTPPEPTPDALQPYMPPGWSAHGADRGPAISTVRATLHHWET